ncbi:MAG: hypothetical protein M0R77_19865 [Gammaproteobacteria bacterium]|nr:hypothetical protein [Gammaproteobacteria bacterium]
MDHDNFLSELERCILANSSSPPDLLPKSYSSDDLASMYLNGDFDPEEDEVYYSEEDLEEEDEDIIQVIYIDDSNFSKLDPEEIKAFINNLSTILGVDAYSEEEIARFIEQCKKPKD